LYYGISREEALGTQVKADAQGQDGDSQAAWNPVMGFISQVSGKVTEVYQIMRGGW